MNNNLACLAKVSLLSCLLFLSGCATTNAVDERDPWEGFNRGVYSFNENVDKVLFDPIGNAYNKVMPDFLNTGISNFFSNLNQIPAIANALLQLKFDKAVNDFVRFFINSTWGLLGFNDLLGSSLPSGEEDFGQTLAHWGVSPGPYFVVPFFGPSTIRDTVGFAADGFLNPVQYLDSDELRAGLLSLNYVDFKADLLSAVDLLEEAALDKYEFTKNAFFDKRANQISDGALEDFPEE